MRSIFRTSYLVGYDRFLSGRGIISRYLEAADGFVILFFNTYRSRTFHSPVIFGKGERGQITGMEDLRSLVIIVNLPL
jgi:hypothetical protein